MRIKLMSNLDRLHNLNNWLKFVKAEINQVISLIELESFALMISTSWRIFDVADIGSVPG